MVLLLVLLLPYRHLLLLEQLEAYSVVLLVLLLPPQLDFLVLPPQLPLDCFRRLQLWALVLPLPPPRRLALPEALQVGSQVVLRDGPPRLRLALQVDSREALRVDSQVVRMDGPLRGKPPRGPKCLPRLLRVLHGLC